MQSAGELAENLSKLLGPGLSSIPHNRFDVGSSGWYVLRAGFRFPAYSSAKLYVDRTGDGYLAAFYIEKGLEHGAIGAPVSNPKLEMNDAWAWPKRITQLTNGDLDRALIAGAAKAGIPPTVLCQVDIPERLATFDIANDYTRWRMGNDGQLLVEGGKDSPFVPNLGQSRNLAEVVRAIENHADRAYMWADLLLGARFPADSSVSTIADLLRLFVRYL